MYWPLALCTGHWPYVLAIGLVYWPLALYTAIGLVYWPLALCTGHLPYVIWLILIFFVEQGNFGVRRSKL